MPGFNTLISPAQLRELLARGERVVLLDCGFDLADTEAGEDAYRHGGHLPGAHYAHLDRDLSAAKTGRNGRHPLPAREDFARRVAAWGLRPGVQAVAYDAQGGPYAARAWWMLRWLGHADAAVLDGGLPAWRSEGGPTDTALPAQQPDAAPYPLSASPAMPTLDSAAVTALLASPGPSRGPRLLDARAPERYRGDVEPLDPVAGHIPGALNRFFKDNLGADGRFLPPGQLRAAYAALLQPAGQAGAGVVHQCGSGVTACHNLLAMAHAGLGDTALYPGSWSEWCADAQRPVARGAEPG
jgi:thiosulfate/3-mercaptopyruvate sulfurtransferase